MTLAYEFTLAAYNLTLLPMIFFSLLFFTLGIVTLLSARPPKKYPAPKQLPFVSIHIPTFNDPVALVCAKRCLDFDYPKDRFEIILADDSTNVATQELLKGLARQHPEQMKYLHRTNRAAFKPGALNEAMPHTKGEIIVLFDADWRPNPDFLKKIVRPFRDPTVAIVQSRQGFYNSQTNLITRFASYLLMIHHAILQPLAHKANCVFLGGTAGAFRRTAFEKVGGWNLQSITEDADLTVKLLLEGYKSVYLDIETTSEVPETFEAFIKQQMRWCYGNVRVFFDHASDILFSPKLSIAQRLLILYLTLGNIIAPIVVLMTIFGFSGWFLGEPQLFQLADLGTMLFRIVITAGFFLLGYVALNRLNKTNEFPYLLISGFTIGLVLSVANSIAFTKAVLNRKLHWHCTPKSENKL